MPSGFLEGTMQNIQTGSKLDFVHLYCEFFFQGERAMLFSAYRCNRLMLENSDSY